MKYIKNILEFLNEKHDNLVKVKINGYTYYADDTKRILYDEDKKNGVNYDKLTKNEREQLYNEIKFPRE